MAETRRAEATWESDLLSGQGVVTASTTQLFTALPVSWASRTAAPSGRTSPEELLAAAHASCFSMEFALELAQAGMPPQRLDVSATVTFDRAEDGWKVTRSALAVRGRVPGANAEKFREIAQSARDNCPISQALKGNVDLTIEATLESR